MQLMQQSSFESLEPRIQDRLIDLADELDRRQYDYYCRGLDQQGEQYRQTLQDTADVRKQGVVALSVLAGLTIVFGGGAVLYLFSKEEYEQGFTLLMAGLGILGAFLGGSGLPGFLRSFVRRSPNGG